MSELVREKISEPLTLDYFHQRIAKGWTVAAVEWSTPATEGVVQPDPEATRQEPPYGQRIAPDCGHLVDDPMENEVLLFIYERVVAGWRPVQIAMELNSSGYRTRHGAAWTPGAVFDFIPRLIELSPKLQARPDWPTRRAKLTMIA